MKRCLSCQELNYDANNECHKCGCSIFDGAYSDPRHENKPSIDKTVETIENINLIDLLQTTSVVIFIVGLVSVVFLLYQFSRPSMFSRGDLNFVEILIVAAIGFYHFVIGIICFGIKEILSCLKDTNIHPSISTERSCHSTSKNEIATDKPKTYNKKRVPSNNSNNDKNIELSKQNTQFVFETVSQLDKVDSKILISIDDLYKQNMNSIYSNLKANIKTENDQDIFKDYSGLPIHTFLDLGLTSPFTDEELNIYRMILEELLKILEENNIDWKKNDIEKQNSLIEKVDKTLNSNEKNLLDIPDKCSLCGKDLINKKTKTGKKVKACSDYPNCKEIIYI